MKKSKGISRRGFLSAIGATAAGACVPLSATAIASAEPPAAQVAENGRIAASHAVQPSPSVTVQNPHYRLSIDQEKGSIAFFQSTFGVDRDLLLANHVRLPLFKIELMTDNHEFKTVTSSQAKTVTVKKSGNGSEQIVTIEFKQIANLPMDACVQVRCPENESLTYWNLELSNGTALWLGHVQFPVVQVPFDDPAKNEYSYILSSFLDGVLAGPVTPSIGSVGNTYWTKPRRNTPDIWRVNNYPGRLVTTQLMAYYNDFGGLYVACDDPAGLPKFLDPLMEEDGITMGLGHFPGVRGPGSTKLPYNVVLGTFFGDWYEAADIYRKWAHRQPFCAKKMSERANYPKWVIESPVGIAFPMRGQGDWDPPAAINPEYTPATNALPYLEKLSSELECSLMPIIFNWEHAGPWVQPDAFPPLGGEDSMKEFMAKAKQKGWHPVIYGDGVSWITAQKNTKYDGMPYFHAHDGEAAVVRSANGQLSKSIGAWRDSYYACVGTEKGRQMVLDMTRGMSELGPDVVQQFDQGSGPAACFAKDHGHPPLPGPWMTENFVKLLHKDVDIARSSNPGMAMSCEGAPPECFLQEFPIWDSRIEVSNCPLYSFLYHEYANGFQGFYTNRVNDEALRLSVARSLVTGYMVSFTLRDKGFIEYDWDNLWSRAVPDQAGILDWAKRTNQFRVGVARDYLIVGRMLRPYKVSNVTERDFGWGKEPLVQSATWEAADGRIGIVLANCADLGQTPRVELKGSGSRQLSLSIDGKSSEQTMQLPGVLDIAMTPRSLCLIVMK